MLAPAVFVLNKLIGREIVICTKGFTDVIGKTLYVRKRFDNSLIAGERTRKTVNMGIISSYPVCEISIETKAVVK